MSVSITVTNADYSQSAIGWEAPTSIDPVFAFIPNSNNLRNLVANQPNPTVSGTTPVFSGAVQNVDLPRFTVNRTAGFNTNVIAGNKLTVVSLVKELTDMAYNELLISNDADGYLQLAKRGSIVNDYYAGDGTITNNSTESVSGNYQVRLRTIDLSTLNGVLSYKNFTTGVAGQTTATLTKTPTWTSTPMIAISGDTNVADSFELAAFLIFNDVLSSVDQIKVTNWLKQYALIYGVSC